MAPFADSIIAPDVPYAPELPSIRSQKIDVQGIASFQVMMACVKAGLIGRRVLDVGNARKKVSDEQTDAESSRVPNVSGLRSELCQTLHCSAIHDLYNGNLLKLRSTAVLPLQEKALNLES